MSHEKNIKLLEHPDSVSVCVFVENKSLFSLGKRIMERHPQVGEDMGGYNWDALIAFYVGEKDAALMESIRRDPEAGMYSAYMKNSPENLAKMKRFEALLKEMLSNDDELIAFIGANVDQIEWD